MTEKKSVSDSEVKADKTVKPKKKWFVSPLGCVKAVDSKEAKTLISKNK